MSTKEADIDVVIVGAGLSGLVAAREILRTRPGTRVRVLEARDRVGGRIYSPDRIDMGATWTWPDSDQKLTRLYSELELRTLPTSFRGQLRLEGSTSQLIARLFQALPPDVVHLDCPVTAVTEEQGGTTLSSSPSSASSPSSEGSSSSSATLSVTVRSEPNKLGGPRETSEAASPSSSSSSPSSTCEDVVAGVRKIQTKAVILALPPLLVLRDIHVKPALPPQMVAQMKRTATWMGSTCIVTLLFDTPFWREGTQSLSPPFYDVSQPAGTRLPDEVSGTRRKESAGKPKPKKAEKQEQAFFGVKVFQPPMLDRMVTQITQQLKGGSDNATLKARVEEVVQAKLLAVLESLFGRQVHGHCVGLRIHKWADEIWTNAGDQSAAFDFGGKHLRTVALHGRLWLAGTESERQHGHMEGAVWAGIRAAKGAVALLDAQT